MSRLNAACDESDYSDLERAGLVKTFEFAFELAWKTLNDLLYFEGFDEKTPRSVLRRAFTAGYLGGGEIEIALDALEKRNLLSHTYDEQTAEEAVRLIVEDYEPMLEALVRRLRSKRDAG